MGERSKPSSWSQMPSGTKRGRKICPGAVCLYSRWSSAWTMKSTMVPRCSCTLLQLLQLRRPPAGLTLVYKEVSGQSFNSAGLTQGLDIARVSGQSFNPAGLTQALDSARGTGNPRNPAAHMTALLMA